MCDICVYLCIAAFKHSVSLQRKSKKKYKRKQRIPDHDFDSMRHSQRTLKTLSI